MKRYIPRLAAFLLRTCFDSRWEAIGFWGLLWICAGCATREGVSSPDDWGAWKERRFQSVAGTNGWTTLAGLHWLAEGANPIGSHPTNAVVLPKGRAPDAMGVLWRHGKTVRFLANPSAGATVDGAAVHECDLVSDAVLSPTRVWVGGLHFWILDRGERMGVRVRDPESPSRRHFEGLRYFPYDPRWRVEAVFESYSEPRVMRVNDATGNKQELKAIGELVFQHAGVTHRLEAVEELGEVDLFVIFRDQTAGETTYGAGRFVYVPRPGTGNRTTLDFNRAYNPPCAFTPFATCPIPPRRNWLPMAIRAGELKPAGAH